MPTYSNVCFSPFDVLRWAGQRRRAGCPPSKIWDLDSKTGLELRLMAKEKWEVRYGVDKIPFTFDGTEDEALKEELGQPPSGPDLPFSAVLPQILESCRQNSSYLRTISEIMHLRSL